MAAAYAAVVSLMNTMEQIQINHPRLFNSSFDNRQIQSLHEYVVFFQHFLEEGRQQVEALESQIAAAAHAAEDVIESHAIDQILAGCTGKRSSFLLDLHKIIQDMDSLKEKVMEVKGNDAVVYNMHQQPIDPIPGTSSKLSDSGKSSMVGFDDYLIQLMEMLLGQQSSRQIISVTGMGGIGKTTLTKNAYENSAIVQSFHIRAWAVITQQYKVREIVIELLCCQKKQESSESFLAFKNALDQKTEDQLVEQLYKFLSGMRYLIVLDDVWSIEAWYMIKSCFPDNGNRSRIIFTTRELEVANHFGSSSLVMNFLDENKSWNLFCEKAFGQQDYCPPELEKIGKQIAKRCKGLPLSIVVIGGLLRESNRSQEHWENIANDINSILLNSREDEISCLNILSLSYIYLPVYLKPCFLYMGVFPEDHKIDVSKLIQLWVAEGFLKPNKSQSLEEVAKGYFQDLVDRNLILVDWRLNGEITTCKIHDLLRDLCLKVSETEMVLCFTRVLSRNRLDMDNERRVVFSKIILEDAYDPTVFHALQSGSLARALVLDTRETGEMRSMFRLVHESLIINGRRPFSNMSFDLDRPDETEAAIQRLLRSLNESEGNLLKPILQQVRYIACDVSDVFEFSLPLLSSISLLWNLQTLVIRGGAHRIYAPSEIWDMRQLRDVEVECTCLCLPDPPRSDKQDDILVNMHTLTLVRNFNLIEDVCKRIPNIKKLGIIYDLLPEETISNYCLYNLGHFHKLETLECTIHELPRPDLLQNLIFPTSLKKLSLSCLKLEWEDLTIIGSLPHLEVLELRYDAVIGPEWNPVEGQFRRLKILLIWLIDLMYWNADNSHFPVLETIILGCLHELDEIPSSIGDIQTLRLIRLTACSVSAAISAIKILDEQESFGNEDFQVQLEFKSDADFESFKEEVEPQTLTSHNLQFHIQN